MYLVPPKTILDLDFIEQNGVQYHRTLKTFDLHNRNDAKLTMAAYVYLSTRTVWQQQIDKQEVIQGNVFKRKDQPNFTYYMFTKEQEKNATLRNL